MWAPPPPPALEQPCLAHLCLQYGDTFYPKLTSIDMSGNDMIGEIPPQFLTRLDRLGLLRLQNNQNLNGKGLPANVVQDASVKETLAGQNFKCPILKGDWREYPFLEVCATKMLHVEISVVLLGL